MESANRLGCRLLFDIYCCSKAAGHSSTVFVKWRRFDESKKVWFIRIGGEDLHRYTYSDIHNLNAFSGTDYFWEDTLLGSMIPFSISTYYNQETGDQSPTYRTGYVGIYHKDISSCKNYP